MLDADRAAIEQAVMIGDLSRLTDSQRATHYRQVCESVGLNPHTAPLAYLNLGGKLKLYANRDATDQLRTMHGVSIRLTGRERSDDLYIVVAEAVNNAGRIDTSTGIVSTAGLKGEALANAMMKSETKAKRRVTLSICGLGMLDESETDSVPGAARVNVNVETGEIVDATLPAANSQAQLQPANKAAMADLSSAVRQALAAGWRQRDIQAEMEMRYGTTSSRSLTTEQARELAGFLLETLDGGAHPVVADGGQVEADGAVE